MSVKVTLSALALALSLPAIAFAGQGNDQLAKIAGVSAGHYSATELAQIDAARDNADSEYLDFLLAHGSQNPVSSLSAGAIMQANILGIVPGSLSVADMAVLDDAISDTDESKIAFQLAKIDTVVSRSETNSTFNAGHLQVAKIAGVEPGRLSTSDLNRLVAAQREGDSVLVRFLLNK
ncbi:MAG: hypothetical protein ACU0CA_11725 [Paracoccaceae bacterium]